jgi:hypothetical protein
LAESEGKPLERESCTWQWVGTLTKRNESLETIFDVTI